MTGMRSAGAYAALTGAPRVPPMDDIPTTAEIAQWHEGFDYARKRMADLEAELVRGERTPAPASERRADPLYHPQRYPERGLVFDSIEKAVEWWSYGYVDRPEEWSTSMQTQPRGIWEATLTRSGLRYILTGVLDDHHALLVQWRAEEL